MVTFDSSGFEANEWFAIVIPTGTAKDVALKRHRELSRILEWLHMQERFSDLGFDSISSSTAQLASFLKSAIARWETAVKIPGAQAE